MLNYELKTAPVSVNGQTGQEREDIWGKDFPKYKKEIFRLGIILMLFGGIIMVLSSPLSIFGWAIPTIQGFAFLTSVIGGVIALKTFQREEELRLV